MIRMQACSYFRYFLLICLGMCAIGFALFQFFHFSVFTVDDAYISFRYAENFAQGDGLVFNKGEFVEGYTNFLWVILLGLLKKIDIDVSSSSLWLGITTSLLTLGFMFLISQQISLKYSTVSKSFWDVRHFIGILFLATSPAFGIWTVARLETPLFSCLLTGAIWLHLREMQQPIRFPISACCFGILALTRPEGMMYFGLTMLYSLVFGWRTRQLEQWRFWKPVLLFLIIVLPHLLWRWYYYGDLLPNTYYMRVGGEFRLSGIKYAYEFFLTYGGFSFFLLCSFLLLLYRSREYWVGCILCLFGMSVLYFIYVGGDWMPGFRFFVPILPLFFLCLQEGLRELWTLWSRKSGWLALLAVASLMIVILLNHAAIFITNPRIDTQYDGHVEIGKFLRDYAEPHDVLAAIDIGAMAYFSGLRTIDYFGLADRHIARLEPKLYTFDPGFWGRQSLQVKADPDYVLAQQPRFIELNTKNHPPTLEATLPADPYSALMYRHPDFQEQYEPFYHAGGTTIFLRKSSQ